MPVPPALCQVALLVLRVLVGVVLALAIQVPPAPHPLVLSQVLLVLSPAVLLALKVVVLLVLSQVLLVLPPAVLLALFQAVLLVLFQVRAVLLFLAPNRVPLVLSLAVVLLFRVVLLVPRVLLALVIPAVVPLVLFLAALLIPAVLRNPVVPLAV